MSRKRSGSVYESYGKLYLAVTLDKRIGICLETCQTREEAEVRRTVIVDLAERLRRAGRLDMAEPFCRQAGSADDEALARILALGESVVRGKEKLAPPVLGPLHQRKGLTLREFGEQWTNNELARRYPGRVKEIDHKDNRGRLENHVYPAIFQGREIGDTPLTEISLDHADAVLAQPTVPGGSLRHVAQCLNRLLNLAVYPARIIDASPLPRGWLPPQLSEKARSYLFPSEEAAFQGNTKVALVRRLFIGFCVREGPRKSNVVQLEWADLSLDLPNGKGFAAIDKTKNGTDAAWALDDGTAEALRLWKRICPSKRWVFPTEAVPKYRRSRAGKPMYVDDIPEVLRGGLLAAGVNRSQLFERTENRLRLRAHDLRATFVTLALANGKTEDWVTTRTGHKSSVMIARYRRQALTVQELNLGWLKPLHEVIPELAAVKPDGEGSVVSAASSSPT